MLGLYVRRIAPFLGITLLMLLLTGCIRPDATTTPVPTGGDVPVNFTQTPQTPVATTGNNNPPLTTTDREAIANFIQTQIGRPVMAGTVDIWRSIPFLNESVIGFSYNNPSSLPCVGVVMAYRGAAGELIPFNGESRCATEPGAIALAGSWLLVSYNTGQILIATVGQVLNAPEPVLTGRVIYSDGVQLQQITVENNRLLNTRPDVYVATQVQFIGQSGNVVADVVIPQ